MMSHYVLLVSCSLSTSNHSIEQITLKFEHLEERKGLNKYLTYQQNLYF